jgi:hypothetical protein
MKLTKDLREFIELFNSHGVEYLLVGAYAFAFHAKPRFTEDLDIFVGSSPENADRIERALKAFGFGSLGLTAKDFTADDQIVQLGQPPNRIDLLTSVTEVNFADAWERRVPGNLDGLPVWFLDKESLIRNKRAVGRHQDVADVYNLTRIKP